MSIDSCWWSSAHFAATGVPPPQISTGEVFFSSGSLLTSIELSDTQSLSASNINPPQNRCTEGSSTFVSLNSRLERDQENDWKDGTRWRNSALSIDSCWWSSAGSGGDLCACIRAKVQDSAFLQFQFFCSPIIILLSPVSRVSASRFVVSEIGFQGEGRAWM